MHTVEAVLWITLHTSSHYRPVSRTAGGQNNSLWTLPISASLRSPTHPKDTFLSSLRHFSPCYRCLHVVSARDTRRDITDLKKKKWRKKKKKKKKNDVELKIPLLVSGQKHFAPGLFPGPLSVMNASDPSICLRLWLVEQSSMFRLTGLRPPLRSVCTSSACLAEWVAIRKGQNLWLKMLCKSMLSLT